MIEEKIRIYCTMLTLSLVTFEVNDLLEGTPFYKHKLKFHSKGLSEELEKVVGGDLLSVFDVSKEEVYSIMDAQKNIAKELALLKPECFPEILKLIQNYKKDYNEHSSN